MKMRTVADEPELRNCGCRFFPSFLKSTEYRNFRHFRHLVILGISLSSFFFHLRNILAQNAQAQLLRFNLPVWEPILPYKYLYATNTEK
jgi:hypothetical protein